MLLKIPEAKPYWEKMHQQIYLIRESQIERREEKKNYRINSKCMVKLSQILSKLSKHIYIIITT